MSQYEFFPQPHVLELAPGGADACGISAVETAKEFTANLQHAAADKLALKDGGRSLLIEVNLEFKRVDEYRIRFAEDKVHLAARDERAAYYGVCTLKQMLEQGGLPANGEIHDWADVEMRILMIDLKRVGWNFDYLMALPERVAEMKINAVLMEYEDKVRFDFCDTIPVESAFTSEQIRAFVAEAEKHYLEVIPLVQCLGHWEYILKHDKYAHVRELPDRIDMGCPLKEETFELFSNMASEILALHPNSRYFHIGADETRLLGCCDQCAARAAESGKSRLYTDHVNRAINWVKEQDRTALFWGDMLLNHPEVSDLCSKDAIVVDWSYQPVEPRQPFIRFRPLMQETGELDYASYCEIVPQDLRDRFDEHTRPSAETRDFDSLPYGTYFQSLGYRVIGASNINNAANVLLHSDNARRKGLLGNLATYWGASSSPRPPYTVYEGRWAGACMLGASGWNAQAEWEQRNDYYERFADYYQGRADLGPVYRGVTSIRMLIPAGGPRTADSSCKADIRKLADLDLSPASLPHAANAELYLTLARKCLLEQELEELRNTLLTRPLLPSARYRRIDLAPWANDSFVHSEEHPGWSRDRNNDLAALPKGDVCFEGIPFLIHPDSPGMEKSVVMVGARKDKPYYPAEIKGIRIGCRARYLSFLHCAVELDGGAAALVGRYVLHYADGTSEEIPLLCDKNIGGWWHATDLPDAAVAWSGANKRCTDVGIYSMLHLPSALDKEIASVDFHSKGNVILALAAVTAVVAASSDCRDPESDGGDECAEVNARLDMLEGKYSKLEAEWRRILPAYVTTDSTDEICGMAFGLPVDYLRRLRRLAAE